MGGLERVYEPRRPLHRFPLDSPHSPALVVRVPPNSPAITVGPLSSQAPANPAPTTPLWQLDGLDNPGLQPDQMGEVAVVQPEPAGTPTVVIDPNDTPPLPDSDSDVEIPQPVSFFTGENTICYILISIMKDRQETFD